VTKLYTNDTPGAPQGVLQEHQSTETEVEEDPTTTKLPDLANSAVVAIHNLATVSPASQASPEIVKSTRKFLYRFKFLGKQ
jgi:hypothetical protein